MRKTKLPQATLDKARVGTYDGLIPKPSSFQETEPKGAQLPHGAGVQTPEPRSEGGACQKGPGLEVSTRERQTAQGPGQHRWGPAAGAGTGRPEGCMRDPGPGEMSPVSLPRYPRPAGYLHSRMAGTPSKGAEDRPRSFWWECAPRRKQEEGLAGPRAPPEATRDRGAIFRPIPISALGPGHGRSLLPGALLQAGERETAAAQSQFWGLSRLSLNK